MFSFLRYCHTVFSSGCTSLHSQHRTSDRISLYPEQNLVLLLSFILAILMGGISHCGFNLYFPNGKGLDTT